MAQRPSDNEAFRRFLRRVWREDVTPLLRDRRADQRTKTARTAGKVAAATGTIVPAITASPINQPGTSITTLVLSPLRKVVLRSMASLETWVNA